MMTLRSFVQNGNRTSEPVRWFETLIITAFCFALGAWNRPDDPFYLTGNFPWPVIAPLLIGLRYGFFMALISALLILAGLGGYLRLEPASVADFPFTWSIGILAVSLLAGEFRDYWERQRQQLSAGNAYRQSRLEEFTRSYYLLKVSHDRLEQQLAGSSSSLREAVRRLHGEVRQDGGPGLTTGVANAAIQLLERYGQLQIAAIYGVDSGRISAEPLATIGRVKPLNTSDPLITHTLLERTLISIQTEYRQKQAELNTELLAAIPLIDSNDQLIGLCAIQSMPFFSFEQRTLRFLAILAGHIADIVGEHAEVGHEGNAELRTLRRHLARSGLDAEQFGLPAALVILNLPQSPETRRITEQVLRIRRGLDVIAEHHHDDRHLIIVLMPLTDELGVAGYLQRLDDEMRTTQGVTLAEWESQPRTLHIQGTDHAREWLDRQLARPGQSPT